MLKILNFSPKYSNKLIPLNFYMLINIILFLSNVDAFNFQPLQYDCQFFSPLREEKCFNNILKFDNKNYQANNFAKNKNGDLVIEFSEDNEISSSRLFYGLTKDGRYFFKNHTSYTYELNINNEDFLENYNYYGIYNSLNLFVSIKNEPNKGNQYLFSINSYYSAVELYNFNHDNNSHYIWGFNDFFNLDEDDYIFPYDYYLFELPKDNAYIISFIPKVIVFEDMLNISFIKKFRFKSFNDDAFEELNSIKYDDYFENKIINTFFMDDYQTFVVLTFAINNKNINPTPPYEAKFKRRLSRNLASPSSFWFIFKFYNRNLKPLNYANDIELFDFLDGNCFQGNELFFKSIYLKNKFVIFISPYYNGIQFGLFELNYFIGSNIIWLLHVKHLELNNFDIHESLNDLIKIDDKRVIFIYISAIIQNSQRPPNVYLRNLQFQNNDRLLIIVIIDITQNFSKLCLRFYAINLENLEPQKQIVAHAYNGYLLFAMNALLDDNSYVDNLNDYFSMFMTFGYVNGTDKTIDISFYLSDNENYDQNKNFFNLLYGNPIIENNIFRYELLNEIKLVSIPKEISLFEKDNLNELSLLKSDSVMISEYIYFLEQNKDLTKNSQYYYIEYQHILKEQDIDEYQSYLEEIPGGIEGIWGEEPKEPRRSLGSTNNNNNNNNLNYKPRIYYGRTNRLKFKLCHEYCETCNELGINNNEQKCSSCLPIYQYDYWYYYNNTQGNCVPEGKFFDLKTNTLTQCDQINYNYYINITDNKTICFKDEHPCPNSYPSFNSTTKECFYCDYFRYKNGECSLNDNNMMMIFMKK